MCQSRKSVPSESQSLARQALEDFLLYLFHRDGSEAGVMGNGTGSFLAGSTGDRMRQESLLRIAGGVFSWVIGSREDEEGGTLSESSHVSYTGVYGEKELALSEKQNKFSDRVAPGQLDALLVGNIIHSLSILARAEEEEGSAYFLRQSQEELFPKTKRPLLGSYTREWVNGNMRMRRVCILECKSFLEDVVTLPFSKGKGEEPLHSKRFEEGEVVLCDRHASGVGGCMGKEARSAGDAEAYDLAYSRSPQ